MSPRGRKTRDTNWSQLIIFTACSWFSIQEFDDTGYDSLIFEEEFKENFITRSSQLPVRLGCGFKIQTASRPRCRIWKAKYGELDWKLEAVIVLNKKCSKYVRKTMEDGPWQSFTNGHVISLSQFCSNASGTYSISKTFDPSTFRLCHQPRQLHYSAECNRNRQSDRACKL